MFKKLFLIFLAVTIVSGCSTNDALTKEFVKHPDYSYAPPNKSIITGSVVLNNGNYGWYVLKQVSTGKTQVVSATSSRDNFSWRVHYRYSYSVGRTYFLELDPGKYEIIDWEYFIPALGGERKLTPRSMKPIKLNLLPGKAIYLGSFNFTTTSGKNIFGISIPAGVEISVTNEKERDFENLIKKYPLLSTNKIEKSLIDYSL